MAWITELSRSALQTSRSSGTAASRFVCRTTSLNGVPGSLPTVVGTYALHELQDAINSEDLEFSIDKENKLVSVKYAYVDEAMEILDLFPAGGKIRAVLIAGTETDALLEDPGFTRPFRGDSNAGDQTTLIQTIEGNEIETLFNNFMDAASVIPDIPEGDTSWADADTMIVDLGRRIVEADDMHWLAVQLRFTLSHSATISSNRNINWWVRARDFRLLVENEFVGDQVPDGFNRAVQATGRDDIATESSHTRMIALTRFTVGENDGLKMGFAGHPSNARPISDIRVRAELHPDISELRFSTKATSGAEGGTYLNPRSGVQAYKAVDENRIVNVDGVAYGVNQRHTSGHSKVVVSEQLTDDGYRGFVTHVNNVSNPMAGHFVYLRGPNGAGGGFERYQSHAGIPTGWYPGYNPFAVGEPWHTAPVAATVDYVGTLTYRGHVLDEANMERNANGVGEAFVLLRPEIVVFVDEYTAPSAGETIFEGKAIVPIHFNNPSLILWGSDQTERIALPAGANNHKFSTNIVLLKWQLDDSEIRFGATSDMVEILAAADAPAAGPDALPATVADRVSIWFKLLPGTVGLRWADII